MTRNIIAKWIKNIVIILCLSAMAVYLFIMNVERKTLLIIHSYGPDYAWVRDINIGIKRVIPGESNYNILWHYMDTKNHPESEYKEKAGILVRRAIDSVDSVNPDVILAIDDDAQEYAAKYYINNKDIQIVFAGINADASQYGYDKANNVTGVLERIPYEGVKNAIQALAERQGLKAPYRVIHISDQSIIVKYDDERMNQYSDWYPVKLLPSKLVDTFDNWKQAVLESQKIADFIIVSNYRKIYTSPDKKTIVSFTQVIEWTFKNSLIPVIGINGFVCEEGAAIAVGTSPFQQGEMSAKIALAILEGRKASDIPIQTSVFPMIFMDEKRSNKSKLDFPQIYKAFAKATNNYKDA